MVDRESNDQVQWVRTGGVSHEDSRERTVDRVQ